MKRRTTFKLLLFLFFLVHSLASSPRPPDTSTGVCKSPGGRFPPFPFEGRPPRKVSKGPKDLILCRVFRQNTCCDVTQTYAALLSVRKLASFGEATEECLQLWEMLECSICDPHVGVMGGLPVICASLCDSIFKSCANAFFSIDPTTKVLSPCGSKDILCSRAVEVISNGSALCELAGFEVLASSSGNQINGGSFCYGGNATFDSVSESWKSVKSRKKDVESGLSNDLLQWAGKMTFIEMVSWAVGGLVLTAGLLFFSKRKSFSYRQRQAALSQAAKKIESKNKRLLSSHGSGKKQ